MTADAVPTATAWTQAEPVVPAAPVLPATLSVHSVVATGTTAAKATFASSILVVEYVVQIFPAQRTSRTERRFDRQPLLWREPRREMLVVRPSHHRPFQRRARG
jgi:hypothetical protein